MRAQNRICGKDRHDCEDGQAVVEFVLILLPLVVFVGGIVQLGLGVANWHDLNRVANEGARFAATGSWPDCPSTRTTCTGNPVCHPPNPNTLLGRSLENYLRCEIIDAGMGGNSVTITVCRPTASALTGDPITVRLTTPLNFLSLDGGNRNKASWLGITLRGQATMRLEQTPTKYTPVSC